MARWEIIVAIGAYTFFIFVMGALFGRWLWIRITESNAEDRWREAERRAIANAAAITQRYES